MERIRRQELQASELARWGLCCHTPLLPAQCIISNCSKTTGYGRQNYIWKGLLPGHQGDFPAPLTHPFRLIGQAKLSLISIALWAAGNGAPLQLLCHATHPASFPSMPIFAAKMIKHAGPCAQHVNQSCI